MNKEDIRNLIKEVINEIGADPLPNSTAIDNREVELKLKLSGRGLKDNKRFRQFIADLRYDAKVADLAIIRAELERAGKIEPSEPEPAPVASKKIEKPPMQAGGAEEWKAMTKRDVAAMRKAAAERRKLGLPPEEDDDEETET